MKNVNEGLHNLKYPPNIVSDPMVNVEINGECSKPGTFKNAQKILVGNHERKCQFGIPKHGGDDKFNLDLREVNNLRYHIPFIKISFVTRDEIFMCIMPMLDCIT
jgi:hypothetical protein